MVTHTLAPPPPCDIAHGTNAIEFPLAVFGNRIIRIVQLLTRFVLVCASTVLFVFSHHCQSGGGSNLREILCVNEDCAIYWDRKKTWRGVQQSHQLLLQLDW